MSSVKITKKYLNSLTGSGKDTFIRDSQLPGFGIKVTPKGTISFIAEARIKRSKTKRVTLGRHPLLPLEDARKKAQEALLLMKGGFDPVELEEEERKERARLVAIDDAKQISLRVLFDEFLKVRNQKPETIVNAGVKTHHWPE
jgi:hypothetical protein